MDDIKEGARPIIIGHHDSGPARMYLVHSFVGDGVFRNDSMSQAEIDNDILVAQ